MVASIWIAAASDDTGNTTSSMKTESRAASARPGGWNGHRRSQSASPSAGVGTARVNGRVYTNPPKAAELQHDEHATKQGSEAGIHCETYFRAAKVSVPRVQFPGSGG